MNLVISKIITNGTQTRHVSYFRYLVHYFTPDNGNDTNNKTDKFNYVFGSIRETLHIKTRK